MTTTSMHEGERFLVLDLTIDSTLSSIFFDAFPYRPHEQLVLLSFSLGLAVIRLMNERLSAAQQVLVDTTSAIAGYAIKERQQVLRLLERSVAG